MLTNKNIIPSNNSKILLVNLLKLKEILIKKMIKLLDLNNNKKKCNNKSIIIVISLH
jgi:hypothetical protein